MICTKSYRIKGKRKRSRTSAEDRFPTIARWGNPICVLCAIKWYEMWALLSIVYVCMINHVNWYKWYVKWNHICVCMRERKWNCTNYVEKCNRYTCWMTWLEYDYEKCNWHMHRTKRILKWSVIHEQKWTVNSEVSVKSEW